MFAWLLTAVVSEINWNCTLCTVQLLLYLLPLLFLVSVFRPHRKDSIDATYCNT